MTTVLTVYAEADPDTKVESKVFARQVLSILQDPRGWPRAGIRFVAGKDAKTSDLWIRLATNDSVKRDCGFNMMSCAWVGGKRSLINLERWSKVTQVSGLSLPDYRRYVINHETGHLLGLHDNMSQGTPDILAPVMVQHTLGPRGYRPNNRPRDDELARVVKLGPARLQIKPKKGGTKKKTTKKKK
jgi:hypothetical protein